MKNAFFTDILRELRKSAGRYLGMFAIVTLGVCVFAGLGSTGSTMKALSDRYYREYNFMDVRVVSTYGISEKDVETIARTDGVADVWPSHNIDAITAAGDSELILRLHSIETGEGRENQINKPQLISGRMPERTGEALVEPALFRLLGLSLGDAVKLQSGTSTDIRASLRASSYRVVGVARSPLYYSNMMGSSGIGGGSVDYYMMIPAQDFRSEIYSEVFVRVEGAAELYTYSDRREELVDEVVERLEALAEIREPERKAELTAAAFEALGAAERTLEAEKASALAGLAEAARELERSGRAISAGRLELARGELTTLDSIAALEENRRALWSGLRALDEGAEAALDAERELRRGMLLLGDGAAELVVQEELLMERFAELRASVDMLEKGEKLLEEQLAKTEADRAQVAEALILIPGDPALTGQLEQLDAAVAYIREQLAALEPAYRQTEEGLKQLRLGLLEVVDARDGLADNRAALIQGLSEVWDSRAQLDSQRQTLASGNLELEEGAARLLEAQIALNLSSLELSGGANALRQGEAELAATRADTLARLAEAEAAIAGQRSALYGIGDPEWYVLGRDANESYVMYGDDADKIHTIGQIIPLLFFLVAALVSLTTMSRLVEEQRGEMGTLKSLGYSTGKILSKYIFYAFAPTFLGSALGGVTGQIIFPSIILTAYSALYPISPYGLYGINYFYWALGLILAVCSTVFTTIYACMGELGSVPAILMRNRAPKVGKKTPLEYIRFFWRRLSFLYKISFRNLFRYKKRFYMTIVGVGLCTALLVVGFGLNESVSGLVVLQFGELHHMDISVVYPEKSKGEAVAVEQALRESGIVRDWARVQDKRVDVSFGGRIETVNMTVPASAEEFDSFVTLRERVGKSPLTLSENGVLVSEKLSEVLGIYPGDDVVIRNADDEEFAARVAGICETYFGHYVFLSPEYYRTVFGEPPDFNTIYATAMPGAPEEALDALANTLLERDKVMGVSLTANRVESFGDSMGSLGMVTWVIVFSSAVLAFVVLLNLTNINITERTREIATIQVLGFRDNEVGAYVYRENRMVAVLGMALGLAGGKYLHGYIMKEVAPSAVMFSPDLGIVNYIFAAALTMFFVVCVDFMTSGKLRKIDMVGALKSTE